MRSTRRSGPAPLVLLPRVAGHRQGDLTDCPGNAFFARLPSIRPQIAALEGVPAALTLAAPSTSRRAGDRGWSSSAGGWRRSMVRRSRAPRSRSSRSPPIGVTTIATVTTAADGTLERSVEVEPQPLLRALHAEPPAASSKLVYVASRRCITLALNSTAPVRVSGTVNPASQRHCSDRRLPSAQRAPAPDPQQTRCRRREGRFSARARSACRPGPTCWWRGRSRAGVS